MQVHKIASNEVSMGQRFIVCTCGHRTSGMSYDDVAERNFAHHAKAALDNAKAKLDELRPRVEDARVVLDTSDAEAALDELKAKLDELDHAG
jgi:hypothetical protein